MCTISGFCHDVEEMLAALFNTSHNLKHGLYNCLCLGKTTSKKILITLEKIDCQFKITNGLLPIHLEVWSKLTRQHYTLFQKIGMVICSNKIYTTAKRGSYEQNNWWQRWLTWCWCCHRWGFRKFCPEWNIQHWKDEYDSKMITMQIYILPLTQIIEMRIYFTETIGSFCCFCCFCWFGCFCCFGCCGFFGCFGCVGCIGWFGCYGCFGCFGMLCVLITLQKQLLQHLLHWPVACFHCHLQWL